MSSKKRVFSGKTVRDAVNKGIRELGVSESDVKVTVLQEPSRGLFGLLWAKEAVVELEVAERSAPEPEAEAEAEAGAEPVELSAEEEDAGEPAEESWEDFREESGISAFTVSDAVELAKEYLADIAEKMGVKAEIETSSDEDGNILFQMKGKHLGLLIGRRGQTLDALQTLVNVYANRLSDEHVRIILDAERFRERRKKTLEDLSMRLANQVVRTKKEVVLEPMSPHERRIIHFKLQNHPKVRTYSKGEEPNRRIVITLKS